MTPEQVNAACYDFIRSDLGQHCLTQWSNKYNELHHTAEGEGLTPAQKAAKVDRAAGLKIAIDFLTTRAADAEKEARSAS